MFHRVTLHDATGGHQAYIYRKIYGVTNFEAGLDNALLAGDEIINTLR